MLKAYHPLRPLDPFRSLMFGGELSPERTPEVEFVTSEGQLFFTSDDEQLVVQEA
jgi:hypothetical protein